jgi:hypothetical protein
MLLVVASTGMTSGNLGATFYGTDDACLASGEVLYLLVDTVSGTVYSNSVATYGPRFSLENLAHLDLGVILLPGVPGPRYSRLRCLPATGQSGASLGVEAMPGDRGPA